MGAIYLIKFKLFFLLIFLLAVWEPSLAFKKFDNDNNLNPTDTRFSSSIPTKISNSFIIKVQVDQKNDRAILKKQVKELAEMFQADMKKANIVFSFIYVYYLAFQGFYIKLRNPEEILDVENIGLNYVLSIEADFKVRLMNRQILTAFPHYAMNVPPRINHQAVNGEGVKIALIDQGIKYAEPPFRIPNKICSQTVRVGCRVKKIYDINYYYRTNDEWTVFYGNAIPEIQNWDNFPVYGNHGTIVASLLGGTDALAPGIAQGVEFYDYRAFPSDEKTAFGVGMLSIEMAILDDVDIIFIAYGRPGNSQGGLGDTFLKKDGKNEILLIAANGNEGTNGWPFQLSNMAQFENSISVGSVGNPVQQCYSISFEANTQYGPELLGLFDVKWINSPHTLFKILKSNNERGVIFLNSQWKFIGERSFIDSNDYALTFIVCDNSDHCQVQFLLAFANTFIPSILIFVCELQIDFSPYQGSNILFGHISTQASEFVEMTILQTIHAFKFRNDFKINESMGLVPSPYTSMGPDASLKSKPTISAIGGKVLAFSGTQANNRPKYIFVSGTSVATAQVVGIVSGVVKQNILLNKRIVFKEVLSCLSNTARMYIYSNTSPDVPSYFHGFAHSVLQQGAGLVNAHAMLHTKLRITPSTIELRKTSHKHPRTRKAIRTISLKNDGDIAVNFIITHVPGLALTYDNEAHQYKQINLSCGVEWQTTGEIHSLNSISSEIIYKLNPNTLESMSLLFKLPPATLREPFTFYNGYIRFIPVFENSDEKSLRVEEGYGALSIPYLVVYGDLETFPVLHGQPHKKAFLTDGSIVKAPKNYLDLADPTLWFPIYRDLSHNFPVFTFDGVSQPVISLCFIFPVKSIAFYLFNFFKVGDPIGFIEEFDHLNANCYLFFVKDKPIFYGDELMDPYDFRLGPENTQAGWSGKYYNKNKRELRFKMISKGTFLICAKIVRQSQNTEVHKYEWCTSPFHAYKPYRFD